MSHRSRLHSLRSELTQPPAPIAPRLDPIQASVEQLVPILLRQGLNPQLQVGWTTDGIVTLFAAIGPLVIPYGFSVADARKFLEALANAVDQADAIVNPVPDEEATPLG